VARLASARRRLFGAFVNGAALARALHGVRRARLVCAGRDGRFAVEDAACAGWLVQRLLEAGLPLRLQPAVGAARALAPRDAAEIRARVWGADHARELRRMGMEFARDVEWCAQVDVCDAVAEGVPLEEGRRS
jgi:2-phosphosulfolactate phosphatase